MYDRLSDGAAEAEDAGETPVAAEGATGFPRRTTQARQTHQRIPASRTNADAPAASTGTRQPRQRIDTEGGREAAMRRRRPTPRHDSRVASRPSRPGRLSRSARRRLTARERQGRANMASAIRGAHAAQAAPTAASPVALGARRRVRDRLVAAIASLAAPLAGAAAATLALVLAALLASQLMGSLFGFWKHEDDMQRVVAGLPPYITYEMVLEALECQEEYGHPAGCTLAQIILESGVGDHLSGLAERDNNLFGIKWSPSFAGCPEVSGCEAWLTGEEYDGVAVTITDYFTCFTSKVASIRFRSRVLLQNPLYADNPIIRRAIAERDSDLMAEGLKDAGYATSSDYVAALVSVMDSYGLRRFDSMSAEDFEASGGEVTGALDLGADASARQQAVVNAAFAETYHEGGYCAEWVMRVYERVGLGRQYGGDARDIYWSWCTSSDLSTLRPGMVIAVPSSPASEAGKIYGHVAVYVGGGMVRDNVGYIRMTPVDEWVAYYSARATPRWGWYGGIPLE
ncbi:hydrolase Nlp/P60 [Coriobacteriales bacterium OH1046]|nr:hydrolase Nlp/P60 [Coriobacteriales bacterium OH1046]